MWASFGSIRKLISAWISWNTVSSQPGISIPIWDKYEVGVQIIIFTARSYPLLIGWSIQAIWIIMRWSGYLHPKQATISLRTSWPINGCVWWFKPPPSHLMPLQALPLIRPDVQIVNLLDSNHYSNCCLIPSPRFLTIIFLELRLQHMPVIVYIKVIECLIVPLYWFSVVLWFHSIQNKQLPNFCFSTHIPSIEYFAITISSQVCYSHFLYLTSCVYWVNIFYTNDYEEITLLSM